MSAKLYNETNQAFEDASIPKIYDGSAYVKTEGRLYNKSESAFEDVGWSANKELVLFDNGDQKTSVTGGWTTSYTSTDSRWTTNMGAGVANGCINLFKDASGWEYAAIGTAYSIDVTKYNTIHCIQKAGSKRDSLLKSTTSGTFNNQNSADQLIAFGNAISVDTEFTADISNISGNIYLVFIGSDYVYASVSKVWLTS